MPTLALTNFNIVVTVLGGWISLFGLVSYLVKENFYLSEARRYPYPLFPFPPPLSWPSRGFRGDLLTPLPSNQQCRAKAKPSPLYTNTLQSSLSSPASSSPPRAPTSSPPSP